MEVIIDKVSISFGDVQVISEFSARFAPGQVTALVGPSGSGKSTLLAAIAGFLMPQAGAVVLKSGETRWGARPELVGWISQGANALGARTVHDNAMLGALADGIDIDEAGDRAHRALRQVGLAHRSGALARTLSGGELQRSAFARALASQRPLVLADEPTSSLDAAATQTVIDLLRDLQSEATVIVATHDPAVIDAARNRVDVRGAVSTNA